MLKIINPRRPFLRRDHSYILGGAAGKRAVRVNGWCKRCALGIHGVLQLG
jgi:hypothetical protein